MEANSLETGAGFAGSIHAPWPDNASEEMMYYGYQEIAAGSPESRLPMLATMNSSNVLTLKGLKTRFSEEVYTEAVGSTGIITHQIVMIIAPPANTRQMKFTVDWSSTATKTGGLGNVGFTLTETDAGGTTHTGSNNFSGAGVNTSTAGSFQYICNFPDYATGDWTVNATSIVSSPPSSPAGTRLTLIASANSSTGHTVTALINATITIDEITLDDGTVYVPVDGSRHFALKQVDAGVVTDISPNDGTRDYGVNRYGFTIRTFDSDRQYALLAGIGNDVNGDADSDYHGVWVSDDECATWTNIVTPIPDSADFEGRPAFEAAFGGDSEQIIFIWGPADTLLYSDDFGASLDSRVGNLASFTPSLFIGLAGGPEA
jgi:hypothetical protein